MATVRELTQRVAAVDEFLDRGGPAPVPQPVRPVQVRLDVHDVPAAARFYTDAFDAVHVSRISSVQFGTYGTDRFFLLTFEAADPVVPSHIGLLVPDVDTTHERAVAVGGGEVHPPEDFAWKPRTSRIRDPSGNLVDLSQG